MENLCKLLFELSNQDRLRILRQIGKEAMNVTNLSKALDLTTQESSRHLSRLNEVGLTVKDVNGFHHVSPLGKLVLKQLPGLEFVSKHTDYFTTHSLDRLPLEFVSRLGDLSDATYIDDIMTGFYAAEKMIREAEEYIWQINDQYLMSTMPLVREALDRGVKIWQIEAKHIVPPPELDDDYFRGKDVQAFNRARTNGLLEERVLERLEIYLHMSEKEVAALAFPTQGGKFDYLGFTSKDEQAHKWCRDVFHYYWERAAVRTRVAEELYVWLKDTPKAIFALKAVAEGKEVLDGKELISELERMGLTSQGKLTILGQIAYRKLE